MPTGLSLEGPAGFRPGMLWFKRLLITTTAMAVYSKIHS